MKFILGTKKEMTQIFNSEDGIVTPVTIISAGPCPVVRIKKSDGQDKYNAVQIGLSGKKKLSKRELGQIKNLGNLQYLREFRTEELDDLNIGDNITVETFTEGDKLKVIGTSKGKGFQGVIKRHGFHGQKATHGNKDQERAHGSIGPTEPARVFPGMKMPGHMGDDRVTVKNLKVAKVDVENNQIYVKGAVPGARGSLVMISADGELKVKTQNTNNKIRENSETSEKSNPASAESSGEVKEKIKE